MHYNRACCWAVKKCYNEIYKLSDYILGKQHTYIIGLSFSQPNLEFAFSFYTLENNSIILFQAGN